MPTAPLYDPGNNYYNSNDNYNNKERKYTHDSEDVEAETRLEKPCNTLEECLPGIGGLGVREHHVLEPNGGDHPKGSSAVRV